MMRVLPVCLILSLLLFSCGSGGLITDSQTRQVMADRIDSRSAWLPTMPSGMSAEESQAMDFLYAYMPLGDVADYGAEYYLQNVRQSLATRTQVAWGDSVPEREFLHFVLPVRVNNENLDSSRMVFYAELRDRVAGLSMRDAILEVNHWCHQRANYSPSDARTMSPLSIVRNATGRCGEESTFAVAALRAVGIPARQIYVPRWAHTDDNHAWVEAWAVDEKGEGRWYYIGACEPEAVLNTGWFDAPAKRSLMMLTKVFGDYHGPEQVLIRRDGYTEISVTQNYAPVSTRGVVIQDSSGRKIEGAKVDFTIYNYATFYPAASLLSDQSGVASLTAGLGDMVVFASKDGLMASGVLDFRNSDTLRLVLGTLPNAVVEYDITPPVAVEVQSVVTPAQREANNVRFAAEDSIRGAYMATFISREASDVLALELGIEAATLWSIMSLTRGNHAEIVKFLKSTSVEHRQTALLLLGIVSIKDLRDTPSVVFGDHLNGAVKYVDRPMFVEYILNPRIDNELLTPYRETLVDVGFSIQGIIAFVRGFALADSLNPARYAISPAGVQRVKMADRVSAERYLIAAMRSNGVAARREPLSRRVQYHNGTEWVYVDLFDSQEAHPEQGALSATITKNGITGDPKLDTHFTLAKWNGERFVPIQFQSLGVDMGGDATLNAIFKTPLTIEEGEYLFTTGTRLADGGILARMEHFQITKGETKKMKLTMREKDDELQVVGAIDPEVRYTAKDECSPVSLLSTTGRGYFVLALIDAKKEPTTHFLRDLMRERESLEAWGRPIVLILSDEQQLASLDLKEFSTLPSTVSFGHDGHGFVQKMLGSQLKIQDVDRRPVVVLGDSFGRVVYLSMGYNTSLGEQLKTTVKKLK